MSNKEKIYFITGGGTGGHIYPAVSVIDALISDSVDSKNIFYIGNKKNLEYEIAKKKNYNFLSQGAKGMPRNMSLKIIPWAIGLFFATLKTMLYFIKYRPNVVFATGGYVCAPSLFCAIIFNVPYMLHDSDIHPGIVTRFFAPGAKNISLAFENAKNLIKSKNININGNPVRQEFKTISKASARKELSLKDDFTILIMGGSLGAKRINDAAFGILKEFANKDGIEIIWQTGKKNFDEVTKKILDEFSQLPNNLVLQPYYDRMYLVLLSSDLVISRAGSLSLSEICASSLPSILVPYPFAAANHQEKNARDFVNNKISLMLEDKDCTQENLLKMVLELMNNKELLNELSYNAYKHAKLDSTGQIVKQLQNIIK